MEVKKTRATSNKTTTEIDIFEGFNIPKGKKSELAEDIGELFVDSILSSVGKSTSPVQGEGKFKSLSKDYKNIKTKDGLPGKANMEFSGDMLDALGFKYKGKGLLEIGVFEGEGPKADGHNNFSGKSKLPKRRFLPGEGENFKTDIVKQAEEIIKSEVVKSVRLKASDFTDISTKTAFWTTMTNKFPDLSRSEIRDTILLDPELTDTIQSLGFLKWLKSLR